MQQIQAGWQATAGNPVDLLAQMQGPSTPKPDGTVQLDRGQKISSPDSYAVPADFRMVVLTENNDVRVAFAANQIIFNWEMDPTQLRVDGGPADGQHKAGAGQLPAGKWVGIELIVRPDQMIIYVNGQEQYRAMADFSQVKQSLSITAHNGSMKIKSITVVQ
jgi:hypothetical protein